MLNVNVFFKTIFLMLLLIENSWAMQNNFENPQTQNELTTIVNFPNMQEIMAALNKDTRKIVKGKFTFKIILPQCFEDDFFFADEIIKMSMQKKRPKLKKYSQGLVQKEKINNYDYYWRTENYVVEMNFLCLFKNNTIRSYPFKISLKLAHDANDTEGYREIQWTGIFHPHEFFLVSNRRFVDSNIVFHNTKRAEIIKILHHYQDAAEPPKRAWLMREYKRKEGGILITYLDKLSRKVLAHKYFFMKENNDEKWTEYEYSNAKKLMSRRDYTPVNHRDKKLSTHIQALYRILEDQGFSLADLIVPANERNYLIDTLLNRLHKSLFFLEHYQHQLALNDEDLSHMPELNDASDAMNEAFDICSINTTRFKDSFQNDARLIENILFELNTILRRVVEGDQEFSVAIKKEEFARGYCNLYREWLLCKSFFYRLGLAELVAVIFDHKFLTIIDTEQSEVIEPENFSQLERREIANLAYAHFYCLGRDPFSKTITVGEEKVLCTFVLKY